MSATQEVPLDDHRFQAKDATVATVYRHICADAVAAASAQDWAERTRLVEMARAIERAYPEASARARFALAEAAGPHL